MAVISKSRKIFYGGVLVCSVALLVGQVLARSKNRSTPPRTVDVPAELPASSAGGGVATDTSSAAPDNTSYAVSAMAEPAASASDAAQSETPSAAGSQQVDAVLAKLEQALGGMHNFVPVSSHAALEAPSGVEGQSQTTSEAVSTVETPNELAKRTSPQPTPLDAPVETLSPIEQLQALLARQPLCGIIRGEHDSQALFGGRIVRAGDQLVPGDAVVKAIESQAVLVRFKDADVRIELPPLRPRPRVTHSSDAGEKNDQASGDETTAGGAETGSPGGATDAATKNSTNNSGAAGSDKAGGAAQKGASDARQAQ